MGLLDDVMGQLGGSGGGAGGGNQMMDLVMGLVKGQGGGLGGLINQFQKGGLGDVAASWVGTGKNLPISADQIASVLGSSQLRQLAQQFGISPDALPGQLAGMLPQVVDKLTPQGQVPDQLPDLGQIGGLLKGLFD